MLMEVRIFEHVVFVDTFPIRDDHDEQLRRLADEIGPAVGDDDGPDVIGYFLCVISETGAAGLAS
jgi:hypothetical protein